MPTTDPDYFAPGPLDPTGGAYVKQRGAFDGIIGFFDGVASLANSTGYIVDEVADARAAWAEGQGVVDDVRLSREEREQAMALEALKVSRGDNVQLYMVAGLAAVALIIVLR
ncbi:hypothetical protein [Tropicibacter alexandrii]|uniref:hypothetical protein n=1 Tax=Tropicibacter alexandrii TaxID=2267683 RepID=UPI000EF4B07C|nr:hypothetical protein [Tropicibacter alexandrii]